MEYEIKSVKEQYNPAGSKPGVKTGQMIVGIKGDTHNHNRSYPLTVEVTDADTLGGIKAKFQAAAEEKFKEVYND